MPHWVPLPIGKFMTDCLFVIKVGVCSSRESWRQENEKEEGGEERQTFRCTQNCAAFSPLSPSSFESVLSFYPTHHGPLWGLRFWVDWALSSRPTLFSRWKDKSEGTYYKSVSRETKPGCWHPPTNLGFNGRFNFLMLAERKGKKLSGKNQGVGG